MHYCSILFSSVEPVSEQEGEDIGLLVAQVQLVDEQEGEDPDAPGSTTVYRLPRKIVFIPSKFFYCDLSLLSTAICCIENGLPVYSDLLWGYVCSSPTRRG